jgi:hypothetical protein
MLQIMQVVGFSSTWCDWVSALLSSASNKVLLNGAPGERVCHACGLRQGAPPLALAFSSHNGGIERYVQEHR